MVGGMRNLMLLYRRPRVRPAAKHAGEERSRRRDEEVVQVQQEEDKEQVQEEEEVEDDDEPGVPLPLVHRVSTCEVPQASLRDPYLITDTR